MTITPSLFEAFLKCPTKCWLRFTGEPPTGNTYAEWVQTEHESYRAEAARRFAANVPADQCGVAPAAAELKTAKWRVAVDVPVRTEPRSSRGYEAQTSSTEINQSLLTSAPTIVKSRLHALERIPSEGRGKAAQLVPIRFIFTNKLGKDDKLLLAFDAYVLSEMLGREVSLGKIIHGDNHATVKVKTSALASEVRKRVEKITALLSNPAPPDLVLNRHCVECEFQARCRKIAVEKDDLSLLAGMSAKERQKLRSKGIFTITQLSYTFRPRRRPKRLRDKREKYHHSLKALAIREKKIHIVGSPELKIEGTPVYLDVEGLPDRDFYYLIGVRIGNGESAVQHSLWADTVEDEGKIWRAFLGILETIEKPVLIHYGSYETTFLRRMCERYSGPPQHSAATKAICSCLNVLSLIFARVYFPTYSNSLKEIGALIGTQWQSLPASGVQSVVSRNKWESCRDEGVKRSLLAYNQDDCHALCRLVAELIQIVENASTLPNVDFANTPKKSTTEDGAEVHATFERILKSAHADYDRSRVRFRTLRADNAEPEGKRVRISPLRARRFSHNAGRILKVPPKRTCPRHPRQPLQPTGQFVERWLIDLVFTRNGVRKTTTGYVGKQTVCPECKVKFSPPTIRRLGPRIFGHSLQAWAVYQRIALRMPLEAIARTISDLFSEDINRVTLMDFMAQFAAEYSGTEKRLLDRILSGSVIHVDETKINIHGENQYVWVLTDGSHVIFRLSPTRECRLIHDLLQGYQGILVSDFYGGYDAVPCRQQKCLVHLIRDFNDDLWKHPFNDEYNQFTAAVRDLLVPMLEEVQKFGLKAYHLKKHKHRVERFYRENIDGHSSCQELTVKYVRRFERYRGSLFTFLERDGVPWNNNAAERAIRHLAVQRKISGAFSSKGANHYLRLLAIAQTCRFQEKSFLGFLLSGLKNVNAYKEARRGHTRRSPASEPRASVAD